MHNIFGCGAGGIDSNWRKTLFAFLSGSPRETAYQKQYVRPSSLGDIFFILFAIWVMCGTCK